jgi:pimeloyl-ACP methyl ester carboxylesterase
MRVVRAPVLIGGGTVAVALLALVARSGLQTATPAMDVAALREHSGVYQWTPGSYLYLQPWNEFTGTHQLVAFDESGDVRVLYPGERDRFSAGPGAAVATPVESRIEFRRDSSGRIAALAWEREGGPARVATRVDIERHEDVRFSNADVQLAGTLILPNRPGRHPAIVLVHGSGAADRHYVLPFARFLVRHGIAVLGYDKRGVGESTGDWNAATFEELAGDVIAAVNSLKNRAEIDPAQIGLLGISQAGWVMPIAAVRQNDIAFLISISGAGVSAAETTIDQARNEMTAAGMATPAATQIVELMRLQYAFAKTGQGWDAYAAARQRLAARMGSPPETFPATPNHPYWQTIRRLYFYDPGPTLRQLRTPTLAVFGELDNNIIADKNSAAWEAALKAGGHRDYTLRIIPGANHLHLEARTGSNREMATLQRFVPEYFATVREWLSGRVTASMISDK